MAISDTAIADAGASDIYVTTSAPISNINPLTPASNVGDASGRIHTSSASENLNLPSLPNPSCLIMPTFKHNLLGIGRLCDHGCTVLFDSYVVTIFSKDNKTILLTVWRGTGGVSPYCK